MPEVTINSIITPHPAPQVDLTDEPPPLEPVSTPDQPAVDVKQPQTPNKPTKIDPDIFCSALPPLPAGWGTDIAKEATDLAFKDPEMPIPPPIISVGELALALGAAMAVGILFGGGISYLLSKPKVVCEA
jgi:hypothetical protein